MKKTLIAYISLAFIFSSCETSTRISAGQLPEYVEKVVVNAWLKNDESVEIELSNSLEAGDENVPLVIGGVPASITFREDQNIIPLTYNTFSGRYEANIIPDIGKKYDITVDLPNFLDAYAQTSFRTPLATSSVIIPNGGVDTTGVISDLLQMTFSDPAAEENYYRIEFLYYSESAGEFFPFLYTTADPALAEYNSFRLQDGSVIFTDEQFNGTQKTLSAVPPFGLVVSNTDIKYLIKLEILNKDMYQYLVTLNRAQESGDNGFSSGFNDAVVIYSNVSNGLGIFSSSTIIGDTLR